MLFFFLRYRCSASISHFSFTIFLPTITRSSPFRGSEVVTSNERSFARGDALKNVRRVLSEACVSSKSNRRREGNFGEVEARKESSPICALSIRSSCSFSKPDRALTRSLESPNGLFDKVKCVIFAGRKSESIAFATSLLKLMSSVCSFGRGWSDLNTAGSK